MKYGPENNVFILKIMMKSGLEQPRTSSRMSVLSKPHFRNRSGYELSKLSLHFFKLEPEILICLPLVPKLIKNQSADIWKHLTLLLLTSIIMAELLIQLFNLKYSKH